MDPPPRSLARRSVRLLHGRDPTWFNRIQAWFAGDCSWPMAGSPRIIAWQTTRSWAVCRRARVGQGQAFGGAEEAPSLTLAARDGDGQCAVGAEECSRRGSNKRINKQGRDKMVCTTVDKESPIQAVCPNWARTDLCGGREVTRVPTAKVTFCAGVAPHERFRGKSLAHIPALPVMLLRQGIGTLTPVLTRFMATKVWKCLTLVFSRNRRRLRLSYSSIVETVSTRMKSTAPVT
jgi:hypothetical protein